MSTPSIGSSSPESEKLVKNLSESVKEEPIPSPFINPFLVAESPLQSFSSDQKKDLGREASFPVLESPTSIESDLTPLVAQAAPPSDVNLDIGAKEWLGSNTEKLCQSIDRAANRMLGYVPENSPKKIAIADLVKIIAQSMSQLQSVLQELQLKETELTTQMSESRTDRAKQRQKDLDEAIKKQQEMERNRSKSGKKQKNMQIASLVVSIVVIAVGVVALPFTCGASSALVIAGLAVSSAMLAYTVADQQFGLTSQAVLGFNQTLEKLFPDKNTRDAVKALILSMAILILCAAVASSPAAGASFGMEIASETSKMLVIQTTMMFLMSSNLTSDLTIDALISSGAIDKNDENAKMITEIVMMIFTMVCCIGVMTTMGPKPPVEGETSILAAKEAVKSESKQLIEQTQRTFSEYIESLPTLKEFFSQALDELVMTPFKGLMSTVSPEFLAEGDWGRFSVQIQDLLRLTGIGVEAYGSITIGCLGLQLSRLLKEIGKLEESQEVLRLLIKVFDDLLNSFQEALSSRGEQIHYLGSSINTMFARQVALVRQFSA